MRQPYLLGFCAGLCALALTGTAAASCGLDLNPGALDRNHNSELSRDETAGTALEGVFDRVDTNRDGAISQSEYTGRCASLQAKKNSGWDSGWEDSVAGKRAERQSDRQQNRVNNRINSETDKATDSAVDKVMGAIFGK